MQTCQSSWIMKLNIYWYYSDFIKLAWISTYTWLWMLFICQNICYVCTHIYSALISQSHYCMIKVKFPIIFLEQNYPSSRGSAFYETFQQNNVQILTYPGIFPALQYMVWWPVGDVSQDLKLTQRDTNNKF